MRGCVCFHCSPGRNAGNIDLAPCRSAVATRSTCVFTRRTAPLVGSTHAVRLVSINPRTESVSRPELPRHFDHRSSKSEPGKEVLRCGIVLGRPEHDARRAM